MPSNRRRITATTADAMANQPNKFIPESGALLNMFAAGVTNSDDIGLLVGNSEILAAGTDINIEISADVLDKSRDQIVFNEPTGGGEIRVPVTVTTEMQFLLVQTYT
jgi:hypothetical protein